MSKIVGNTLLETKNFIKTLCSARYTKHDLTFSNFHITLYFNQESDFHNPVHQYVNREINYVHVFFQCGVGFVITRLHFPHESRKKRLRKNITV